MVLTQASRQWATRPADERYTSLYTMRDHFVTQRQNSRAKVIPSRLITAQADGPDHKGLVVVGPNGGALAPTHYAFGQLAQRAGAPAGYLRGLPSELAADCINYGLHVARAVSDVGVLLYRNGGPAELRAVTGPAYGRIWNADVLTALTERFGDGVTGDFRIPGEFGVALREVTRDNTTLYASDRDMFVFLADEEHRIELPHRRDAKAGSLARGFFVWNSEVGDATFGIGLFLFDYACCNRIVWGAEGYTELRLRHTVSAPGRFLEEVTPTLLAYARSATEPMVACLEAARAAQVDDLDKFLAARKFTASQIESIQAVHVAEEHRPIETIWDVTTGITAYARGMTHQNERVELERVAGKILQLAVA